MHEIQLSSFNQENSLQNSIKINNFIDFLLSAWIVLIGVISLNGMFT